MDRAFTNRDFAAFYDQLSPESQEQLLPLMTALAGAVASDEASMQEYNQILRRYGIEDINKEPEPGAESPLNPIVLFKDVKDRRGLFGEVMAFAHSRQPKEEVEETQGLEDLKVEGDVANGVIVKKLATTGEIRRDPISFKRVGGRWFADKTP